MFTTRLKEEIPKTLVFFHCCIFRIIVFLQKNLFDSIMISGARIVELDLSDNAIGYNNRLTVMLIIYVVYYMIVSGLG